MLVSQADQSWCIGSPISAANRSDTGISECALEQSMKTEHLAKRGSALGHDDRK